jgi:DNA-binding beta-propeller fold protein YncE
LLKTLGTPGKAGDDENHLNKPTDMAITPSGDVFVSDGYGNDRIVHFNKNGEFVKAWGKTGTAPGEFNLPHAIVVDSKGILYVADRSNGRVQVFDQSGKFLSQWQNLIVPWGICITEKDELWICGSSPMNKYKSKYWELPPKDQVVMKFNTKGNPLLVWSLPKGLGQTGLPGEVNWLHSVAIDSKSNFYLGDIRGQRAQKFVKKP